MNGDLQSVAEKGSDPLEASRFFSVIGLAGEGQTPFRTGMMGDAAIATC